VTRVTFDQVNLGDSLPPLRRYITQDIIDQNAVASLDYNPVHINAEWCRAAHVLVGSSNLTLGGLQTNIESNLAGSFPLNHRIVRQWRKNFDIIWAQGIALESALDRLRQPTAKEGGISMEMPKQATDHPLPVGSAVVVHGERGRVLATENIGANRFRYEILLEASGQAKKWVTPPTAIRLWLGPLDVALSGQFSSPLEYDLRTESLRLSLAYEYDRMVSLSSSRVNLEPYQVEAVHKVVNSFPHRFLIADDTGLSKTMKRCGIREGKGVSDRVTMPKKGVMLYPFPLI